MSVRLSALTALRAEVDRVDIKLRGLGRDNAALRTSVAELTEALDECRRLARASKEDFPSCLNRYLASIESTCDAALAGRERDDG